jgi:DNA-binding transcriptional LysR family regulator
VHGADLEGWVRLGLSEDFGEALLPAVLGRFARAHPKVRIEARIARTFDLLDRIGAGQLDLALAWGDSGPLPHGERLAELPMRWVGPAAGSPSAYGRTDEPLPLAALEAPCLLRTAATAALDRAGVPWRLSFVSPSLAGLWAAVAAGLGVTVRTDFGLPGGVRVLGAAEAPALPSLPLTLHRAEAEPGPVAARLAAILAQSVRDVLPGRAAAA